MFRPTKAEGDRRTTLFYQLVADGTRLNDAAKEAHVKPQRALRLVSDPHFWPTIDRMRARP